MDEELQALELRLVKAHEYEIKDHPRFASYSSILELDLLFYIARKLNQIEERTPVCNENEIS